MNSILQGELHYALVCPLRHTTLEILLKKCKCITTEIGAPLHQLQPTCERAVHHQQQIWRGH